MTKPRTITRDRGYQRVMDVIGLLEGSPHVAVGFFSGGASSLSDEEKAGLSPAEYMFINEVGTDDGDIPPRPAMATTADEQSSRLHRILGGEIPKMALGRSSVKKALTLVGIEFRNELTKAVHAWHSPPNALTTQIQKGSEENPEDNPLVDTGTAVNSIQWEVRGA